MSAARPAVVVDLNADLGEGCGHDSELLEVVTSANVACGFHAGDPVTVAATVEAAVRRGVAVGAHPSYDDREGFGRRPVDLPEDHLRALLAFQVGGVAAVAASVGGRVRYLKPHGALYNRAAVDARQATVVAEVAAGAGLALLCPPGSRMQQAAEDAGVPTYTEAFADRRYAPDGALVPRGQPGAVITDVGAVVDQALSIVLDGVAPTASAPAPVAARSLCLHGDTPRAVELAVAVRDALVAAGVALRPFAG